MATWLDHGKGWGPCCIQQMMHYLVGHTAVWLYIVLGSSIMGSRHILGVIVHDGLISIYYHAVSFVAFFQNVVEQSS